MYLTTAAVGAASGGRFPAGSETSTCMGQYGRSESRTGTGGDAWPTSSPARSRVVTGAGSGLGAALARAFAGAGAAVAAPRHRRAGGPAAPRPRSATPAGCRPRRCGSMSATRDPSPTAARARRGDPRRVCTLLCTNVGVQQFGALDRLTEEQLDVGPRRRRPRDVRSFFDIGSLEETPVFSHAAKATQYAERTGHSGPGCGGQSTSPGVCARRPTPNGNSEMPS